MYVDLIILYKQFNFGLVPQTFGLVTLSNSLPEGQPHLFIFVSPCSFLMVKLASCIDHGRVRPAMTTNDDIEQHGGHPAITRSCSLGLKHMSLILDIHMMFY